MKRKFVYHRKYHILNVINDIAHNNNIQVAYYNREKILRIFRLIDQVTPEVNNFHRKKLISVNFIIKRLFDIFRSRIQDYSYYSVKKYTTIL